MSIVFYGYRVRRERFWEAVDRVREIYAEESLLAKAATRLGRRAADGAETFTEAYEKLNSLLKLPEHEHLSTELQVFDEDDEHYVVRPLEAGLLFHNLYDRYHWSEFEPVYLDARADVPPEHEANRPVVDRVNRLIEAKHYFITPIFDNDAAVETFLEAVRERAQVDEAGAELLADAG